MEGGFPLIIEMMLSGFLFLFIIITKLASERFGHETFSDLDSDAKLQQINDDPKKFKISTVLLLIEHASIIALAIMLFIAFSPLTHEDKFITTSDRISHLIT